tara:strand:+ start:562 stop:1311 length:750 start_codon:yes stop_codon:yes gene_type:complete
MLPYKRPPILEAIIDVQFKTELSEATIAKITRKLKQKYPVEQNAFKDVGVLVEIHDGGARAHAINDKVTRGKRLESNDSEWVIILYPKQFSFIRLAPYSDWDEFFKEFNEFWNVFRKEQNSKTLSRLAVRYVNRIDIPTDKGVEAINIADYLHVGVHTPQGLIVDGYEASFKVRVDDTSSAIIRTATHTKEIPNTAALLLDIDLFMHDGLPQKNDEILDRLNLLRKEKNNLFEKFISDKARELFNREVK